MVTKMKFFTGEEFEISSCEMTNECMSLEVTFVLGDKTKQDLESVITNTRSLLSMTTEMWDDEMQMGGGSYGGYWGSRTVIGDEVDGTVTATLNRVDVERDSLEKQAVSDYIAMETGVDLDA